MLSRIVELLVTVKPKGGIAIACDYTDLAKVLGVSVATIHNWREHNTKRKLSQKNLTTLRNAIHRGLVGDNLLTPEEYNKLIRF